MYLHRLYQPPNSLGKLLGAHGLYTMVWRPSRKMSRSPATYPDSSMRHTAMAAAGNTSPASMAEQQVACENSRRVGVLLAGLVAAAHLVQSLKTAFRDQFINIKTCAIPAAWWPT